MKRNDHVLEQKHVFRIGYTLGHWLFIRYLLGPSWKPPGVHGEDPSPGQGLETPGYECCRPEGGTMEEGREGPSVEREGMSSLGAEQMFSVKVQRSGGQDRMLGSGVQGAHSGGGR